MEYEPGLLLPVGICGCFSLGLQQTNAPSQVSLTQCHKGLSLPRPRHHCRQNLQPAKKTFVRVWPHTPVSHDLAITGGRIFSLPRAWPQTHPQTWNLALTWNMNLAFFSTSESAVASPWACNKPTLPAKSHSHSATWNMKPGLLLHVRICSCISLGLRQTAALGHCRQNFHLPRKPSTPTHLEPGTHMEYAAWPASPHWNLRLHLFGPATNQRSQPSLTHAVPQTAQSHMTSPSLSAESSACQELGHKHTHKL